MYNKVMRIIQEHRAEIEELVAKTKCQFNFECYKSEFEHLSHVSIELDGQLLWCVGCLGDDGQKICNNRLSYGDNYLCTCPLREYIARNLHK